MEVTCFPIEFSWQPCIVIGKELVLKQFRSNLLQDRLFNMSYQKKNSGRCYNVSSQLLCILCTSTITKGACKFLSTIVSYTQYQSTAPSILANPHTCTKGANYASCLRNYHSHSNYPGNGHQGIKNVDSDIPAERKPAKVLRRVIVSRIIGILGLCVCVYVCVCGCGGEGEGWGRGGGVQC